MKSLSGIRVVSLAAVVCLGCDAAPVVETVEEAPSFRNTDNNGIELNGLEMNGIELNGIEFNGLEFNGIELNGIELNGIEFNGIEFNGIELNGLELNGSTLSGVTTIVVGGEEVEVPVEGEDFLGAEFNLTMGGQNHTLRIDNVFVDPESPEGDVYLYNLTYFDMETGEWEAACGNEANEATVVGNTWDPETGDRVDNEDTLTFACAEGAISKCVMMGYRPWAEHDGVSLQDHHQACTRMVRADYCGDGMPHTMDGLAIDVADTLEEPIESHETSWPVEAEWDTEGALCIRKPKKTRWKLIKKLFGAPKPECFPALNDVPKCGKNESGEALLISKFKKSLYL